MFRKLHSDYEALEKRLHAKFLAGNRKRPPPAGSHAVEDFSLPDTFVVRFDEKELVSDPLPPPPRILRTPARFRDSAQSASAFGAANRRRSGGVAAILEDPARAVPVRLGNLTVLSLGEIVFDQPGFHSDRLLFPLGYKLGLHLLSFSFPPMYADLVFP